jgi:hypothetical protein
VNVRPRIWNFGTHRQIARSAAPTTMQATATDAILTQATEQSDDASLAIVASLAGAGDAHRPPRGRLRRLLPTRQRRGGDDADGEGVVNATEAIRPADDVRKASGLELVPHQWHAFRNPGSNWCGAGGLIAHTSGASVTNATMQAVIQMIRRRRRAWCDSRSR